MDIKTAVSAGTAEIKMHVGAVIRGGGEVETQMNAFRGPPGKDYVLTDADKREIAEILRAEGAADFETDETLTFKDGLLSVNTAEIVEKDNTLPVTSAAVYNEVGNINALLATI